MDLPILKHLDTLIGLAVVMLIASTVVVAVTQLILSMRRARSLYLRETLTDLISQPAPKLTRKPHTTWPNACSAIRWWGERRMTRWRTATRPALPMRAAR
jgi:hypothetical protein